MNDMKSLLKKLVSGLIIASAALLFAGWGDFLDKVDKTKDKLPIDLPKLPTTILVLQGAQEATDDEELGAILGGLVLAYQSGLFEGLTAGEKDEQVSSVQVAAESGESSQWVNEETGNRGEAKVVATQNTVSQQRVPVKKGRVSEVPPLELVGKPYRATERVAVYGGPGRDYEEVSELKADSLVDVVGKVKNADWFAIRSEGALAGFVTMSSLSEASDVVLVKEEADDSEVEYANVDVEQPVRTIEQTVTLADGTTRTETVQLVKGVDGVWVMQPTS